jgi:hypothetical protein
LKRLRQETPKSVKTEIFEFFDEIPGFWRFSGFWSKPWILTKFSISGGGYPRFGSKPRFGVQNQVLRDTPPTPPHPDDSLTGYPEFLQTPIRVIPDPSWSPKKFWGPRPDFQNFSGHSHRKLLEWSTLAGGGVDLGWEFSILSVHGIEIGDKPIIDRKPIRSGFGNFWTQLPDREIATRSFEIYQTIVRKIW